MNNSTSSGSTCYVDWGFQLNKGQRDFADEFIEKCEAYSASLGKGHTKADRLNAQIADLSKKMISEGNAAKLAEIAFGNQSQAAATWACMMLIDLPSEASPDRPRLAARLRSLESQAGLMGMVIIGFLASRKM